MIQAAHPVDSHPTLRAARCGAVDGVCPPHRVPDLGGDTLHRPLRGLRPGAPDDVREALDLPAPGHDERFWRGGHRCAGAGLRPPRVGAVAPGDGGGSVAWSSRPITPFMHYPPRSARSLYIGRSSTNIKHSMHGRHLPTSHSPQGL